MMTTAPRTSSSPSGIEIAGRGSLARNHQRSFPLRQGGRGARGGASSSGSPSNYYADRGREEEEERRERRSRGEEGLRGVGWGNRVFNPTRVTHTVREGSYVMLGGRTGGSSAEISADRRSHASPLLLQGGSSVSTGPRGLVGRGNDAMDEYTGEGGESEGRRDAFFEEVEGGGDSSQEFYPLSHNEEEEEEEEMSSRKAILPSSERWGRNEEEQDEEALESLTLPGSYSYEFLPNQISSQTSYQGLHIRSCGHRMHLTCYRRYQKSQQNYLYLSELLLPCPYCHQPCNLLLIDSPPPPLARIQLHSLLRFHMKKKQRQEEQEKEGACHTWMKKALHDKDDEKDSKQGKEREKELLLGGHTKEGSGCEEPMTRSSFSLFKEEKNKKDPNEGRFSSSLQGSTPTTGANSRRSEALTPSAKSLRGAPQPFRKYSYSISSTSSSLEDREASSHHSQNLKETASMDVSSSSSSISPSSFSRQGEPSSSSSFASMSEDEERDSEDENDEENEERSVSCTSPSYRFSWKKTLFTLIYRCHELRSQRSLIPLSLISSRTGVTNSPVRLDLPLLQTPAGRDLLHLSRVGLRLSPLSLPAPILLPPSPFPSNSSSSSLFSAPTRGGDLRGRSAPSSRPVGLAGSGRQGGEGVVSRIGGGVTIHQPNSSQTSSSFLSLSSIPTNVIHSPPNSFLTGRAPDTSSSASSAAPIPPSSLSQRITPGNSVSLSPHIWGVRTPPPHATQNAPGQTTESRGDSSSKGVEGEKEIEGSSFSSSFSIAAAPSWCFPSSRSRHSRECDGEDQEMKRRIDQERGGVPKKNERDSPLSSRDHLLHRTDHLSPPMPSSSSSSSSSSQSSGNLSVSDSSNHPPLHPQNVLPLREFPHTSHPSSSSLSSSSSSTSSARPISNQTSEASLEQGIFLSTLPPPSSSSSSSSSFLLPLAEHPVVSPLFSTEEGSELPHSIPQEDPSLSLLPPTFISLSPTPSSSSSSSTSSTTTTAAASGVLFLPSTSQREPQNTPHASPSAFEGSPPPDITLPMTRPTGGFAAEGLGGRDIHLLWDDERQAGSRQVGVIGGLMIERSQEQGGGIERENEGMLEGEEEQERRRLRFGGGGGEEEREREQRREGGQEEDRRNEEREREREGRRRRLSIWSAASDLMDFFGRGTGGGIIGRQEEMNNDYDYDPRGQASEVKTPEKNPCASSPMSYERNAFIVHPLAMISKVISDTIEHAEMSLRETKKTEELSLWKPEVLHGCYAVYLHLADELQHIAIGEKGFTAFDLYLHDLELTTLYHCPLFSSPVAQRVSSNTFPIPFDRRDSLTQNSTADPPHGIHTPAPTTTPTTTGYRHTLFPDSMGTDYRASADGDKLADVKGMEKKEMNMKKSSAETSLGTAETEGERRMKTTCLHEKGKRRKNSLDAGEEGKEDEIKKNQMRRTDKKFRKGEKLSLQGERDFLLPSQSCSFVDLVSSLAFLHPSTRFHLLTRLFLSFHSLAVQARAHESDRSHRERKKGGEEKLRHAHRAQTDGKAETSAPQGKAENHIGDDEGMTCGLTSLGGTNIDASMASQTPPPPPVDASHPPFVVTDSGLDTPPGISSYGYLHSHPMANHVSTSPPPSSSSRTTSSSTAWPAASSSPGSRQIKDESLSRDEKVSGHPPSTYEVEAMVITHTRDSGNSTEGQKSLSHSSEDKKNREREGGGEEEEDRHRERRRRKDEEGDSGAEGHGRSSSVSSLEAALREIEEEVSKGMLSCKDLDGEEKEEEEGGGDKKEDDIHMEEEEADHHLKHQEEQEGEEESPRQTTLQILPLHNVNVSTAEKEENMTGSSSSFSSSSCASHSSGVLAMGNVGRTSSSSASRGQVFAQTSKPLREATCMRGDEKKEEVDNRDGKVSLERSRDRENEREQEEEMDEDLDKPKKKNNIVVGKKGNDEEEEEEKTRKMTMVETRKKKTNKEDIYIETLQVYVQLFFLSEVIAILWQWWDRLPFSTDDEEEENEPFSHSNASSRGGQDEEKEDDSAWKEIWRILRRQVRLQRQSYEGDFPLSFQQQQPGGGGDEEESYAEDETFERSMSRERRSNRNDKDREAEREEQGEESGSSRGHGEKAERCKKTSLDVLPSSSSSMSSRRDEEARVRFAFEKSFVSDLFSSRKQVKEEEEKEDGDGDYGRATRDRSVLERQVGRRRRREEADEEDLLKKREENNENKEEHDEGSFLVSSTAEPPGDPKIKTSKRRTSRRRHEEEGEEKKEEEEDLKQHPYQDDGARRRRKRCEGEEAKGERRVEREEVSMRGEKEEENEEGGGVTPVENKKKVAMYEVSKEDPAINADMIKMTGSSPSVHETSSSSLSGDAKSTFLTSSFSSSSSTTTRHSSSHGRRSSQSPPLESLEEEKKKNEEGACSLSSTEKNNEENQRREEEEEHDGEEETETADEEEKDYEERKQLYEKEKREKKKKMEAIFVEATRETESLVRQWRREVEDEPLEWEGDVTTLEEIRRADDLSASVWLEDLRLLGRRLPFPPRKEQIGAAILPLPSRLRERLQFACPKREEEEDRESFSSSKKKGEEKKDELKEGLRTRKRRRERKREENETVKGEGERESYDEEEEGDEEKMKNAEKEHEAPSTKKGDREGFSSTRQKKSESRRGETDEEEEEERDNDLVLRSYFESILDARRERAEELAIQKTCGIHDVYCETHHDEEEEDLLHTHQRKTEDLAKKKQIRLLTPSTLLGGEVCLSSLDEVTSPFGLLEGTGANANKKKRREEEEEFCEGANNKRKSEEEKERMVKKEKEKKEEEGLKEEERKKMIVRIVEAGLVPWLRKLHLLAHVTYPPQALPFDEIRGTYEMLGGADVTEASVLSCSLSSSSFQQPSSLLHPSRWSSSSSSSSFFASSTSSSSPSFPQTSPSSYLARQITTSLSDLLSPDQIDLYDPSEECSMLLEALPLPRSIQRFLFGKSDESYDEEEEEEDDMGHMLTSHESDEKEDDEEEEDSLDVSERRKESSLLSWIASSEKERKQIAKTLGCCASTSMKRNFDPWKKISEAHAQFLASLSAFPPLAVSLSTLVPIVVSSRDGHDSILHLFKRQLQAFLSSASTAVSPSPFLHPSLYGDGMELSPHERGFFSEKEEKDPVFSFRNLDPLLRYHMLYFHPLSRRFLPEDFVSFLSYTKMKCSLLYSTEIRSLGGDAEEEQEGERKTIVAVCMAQYLPHPTVLPKLYQQFYNYFLQLGAFTSPTGIYVTPPSCGVCLTCGAFLCAMDCCDMRVPASGGSTRTFNRLMNLRRHAISCGMGIALYLHLSASAVYVAAVDTAVDRDAKWGCLHLDVYGEEDPLLKRGKPLHLSLNRLCRLTDDWRQHQLRLLRRLQWSRMESSVTNHATQGM
ncbi:zinc finger in n-recognin protein [Cystoisospora suis]|uniref:Zinc finger in n-recognin protein n=1 Tax=Cystoisospora suis TaxID=483139 RepID=A0A2C6KMJ3_9APIC|nr:zinc finger in n-recognin protein [Cystoisospora suis]